MAKTDEILNHVIAIKEDVAGIKQHLKDLNSKVATNVKHIEENKILAANANAVNEDEIKKINLKLAKWGGVMITVFAILQLVFHVLLG